MGKMGVDSASCWLLLAWHGMAASHETMRLMGAGCTGCFVAIGALQNGRSRHIRLTVPGFLNAKKAI
jgi:hypothetical protein